MDNLFEAYSDHIIERVRAGKKGAKELARIDQHFVVELLARMPKEQLDGFSQELVERFPNLAETLSSNFEAYLEDRAVLSGRHDPEGAE